MDRPYGRMNKIKILEILFILSKVEGGKSPA